MTDSIKTIYPEIEWVNQGEIDGDDKRWKGESNGFRLDCRYQWHGPSKGSWVALVNSRAIQTGTGPYGYQFPDEDAAKAAAEEYMRQRIDHIVARARNYMDAYTTWSLTDDAT